MAGPGTLFSGKTRPGGEKAGVDNTNARFAIYVALIIAAPVGALVAFLWITSFLVARVSWKWIAAAAFLIGTVVLLTGTLDANGIAHYTLPYRDLAATLQHKPGAPAGPRWGTWFLAQLPIGLFLGTTFAAGSCFWRWLRRARWRDEEILRNRRLSPLDMLRLNRTRAALSDPGSGPPADGLRLGMDRFGTRVDHTDREGAGHMLVLGGTGSGKALDLDTPIPTPDGFRRMGDLNRGDHVFAPDGQPVEVIEAHDVQTGRTCYEIVFSDDTRIVADAEHLWLTETAATRNNRDRHPRPASTSTGASGGSSHRQQSLLPGVLLSRDRTGTQTSDRDTLTVPAHGPQVRTTEQIRVTLHDKNGYLNHSVAPAAPVNYPTQVLPLDPYLLGASFGDGPAGPENEPRGERIPEAYLLSSVQQRRDLLAGLMDTNGTVGPGRSVSYTSTQHRIAEQTQQLAHSLGYAARLSRPNTRACGPSKTRDQRPAQYTVTFATGDPVFRLDHKTGLHLARATGYGPDNETGHRYITAVRPVKSRPVRCIKVANDDGLFLAGQQYIPTHNTMSILGMLRDAIALGRPVIFIDLKGGPDVPERLAELAARHGRVFRHWLIQDPRAPYTGPASGPGFYDPLGRGDPSRRKDLLIGSQKWDVEHYKTVVGNYIQTALNVSDLVPPAVGASSFDELAILLNPTALRQRADMLPVDGAYEELRQAVTGCAVGMGADELSGIRGMANRLRIMTGSTAGAWLRKDPSGTHDINLGKAVREGEVVVFSLDSSLYEDTAAQLAGLIVQDLKTLSSELRTNPAKKPVHVVLDEFAAAGSTNVLGLLNKARDANMRVMLSTQALADLTRNEPQFAEQVLGIVGSFVLQRVNTQHDAEIYAGLTGMVKRHFEKIGIETNTGLTGAMTRGTASGSGTLEEVDGYRVEPGYLQELPIGGLVYVAKIPQIRVVETVRVIMEVPKAAVPERVNETPRPGPALPPGLGTRVPVAALPVVSLESQATAERWHAANPVMPDRGMDPSGFAPEPEWDVGPVFTDTIAQFSAAPWMQTPAPDPGLDDGPSVFGSNAIVETPWVNGFGAEDTTGVGPARRTPTLSVVPASAPAPATGSFPDGSDSTAALPGAGAPEPDSRPIRNKRPGPARVLDPDEWKNT